MNTEKWIQTHTESLRGKLVAVAGSTGGLGRELCRHLVRLGAALVLLDRNAQRASALRESLLRLAPQAQIRHIPVDLEDVGSVKRAAQQVRQLPVDVLILNAGAYCIPRQRSALGLDNVFQINFVSPYYLTRELLPVLRQRSARVVAVSSIACRLSESDPNDCDFSARRKASAIYGNAKRYWTFALYDLFRGEEEASLAVAHPGISPTGITAHYPKWVSALIKYPMRLLFMAPGRACLSILRGVFEACGDGEWIGPRVLNIWGWPKKRRLRACRPEEAAYIAETAERLYTKMREFPEA